MNRSMTSSSGLLSPFAHKSPLARIGHTHYNKHMTKPGKKYLSALLLVLSVLSVPSTAQEAAKAYQLELLIVKHSDTQLDQLEKVINPNLEYRLQQAALDIFKASSDSETHIVADTSRFHLNAEAQKFEDSDQFEVLYHIVWQQPPYSRAQAKHINIVPEPVKGLLKGIAWASYERYFQLRLDFQYDASFEKEPQLTDSLSGQRSPISIHIKKILGEGELHYLDHPAIGILAYITAVEDDGE